MLVLLHPQVREGKAYELKPEAHSLVCAEQAQYGVVRLRCVLWELIFPQLDASGAVPLPRWQIPSADVLNGSTQRPVVRVEPETHLYAAILQLARWYVRAENAKHSLGYRIPDDQDLRHFVGSGFGL